ncbi:MAG: glycosyltransferase family 2 protein [Kiritimatiellia bacterium]
MPSGQILISVIIPVYNGGQYLPDCIDSVLAARGNWESLVEVICVDDGSTDDSAQLATLRGVRVIRQNHEGVSAARNRGLLEASGAYVWFVDGDDVVAKDALAEILQAVDTEKPPDIVLLGFKKFSRRIDFSGGGLDGIARFFNLMDFNERREAYSAYADNMLAWSIVCRRSCACNVPFRLFSNGEDSLWAFQVFLSARSMVCLNRVFYGYRQRIDGASRQYTLRRWGDFCCVTFLILKAGLEVRALHRSMCKLAAKHVWYMFNLLVNCICKR